MIWATYIPCNWSAIYPIGVPASVNNHRQQDFEQLAQQILQQDATSLEKIRRVEAAAERVQRLQVGWWVVVVVV